MLVEMGSVFYPFDFHLLSADFSAYLYAKIGADLGWRKAR